MTSMHGEKFISKDAHSCMTCHCLFKEGEATRRQPGPEWNAGSCIVSISPRWAGSKDKASLAIGKVHVDLYRQPGFMD